MAEKLERIYSTILEEEKKLERGIVGLAKTITLQDIINATEGYNIIGRNKDNFKAGNSIRFHIEEGRFEIVVSPKLTEVNARGYYLREYKGKEAENYYKDLELKMLQAKEIEEENLPF